MNRLLSIFCVLAAMVAEAFAQGNSGDLDLFKKIDLMPGAEKTPAVTSTGGTASPAKEPTIITASTEASFDGKLKMAIFIGDVRIKDPQFTLTATKMTVYFKKDAEGDKSKTPGGAKPSATPKPSPSPAVSSAPGSGGLERVVAEGNVIVESDRPDSNGGPPVHYVGKAAKLDYNAINGEAILYGWPQVQQGINTIVATEESTVIHLFRDGKMKIDGAHKVNINDPGPGKTPEAK